MRKLMGACVKGGCRIAVKQSNGSYKFYYFNGKFFKDIKALDGTEGQNLLMILLRLLKKRIIWQ